MFSAAFLEDFPCPFPELDYEEFCPPKLDYGDGMTLSSGFLRFVS